MSANKPLNMSNPEPLVETSAKGYRVLHSYPFINDGLKFNAEQDCAIVPKTRIKQQQEIKPAWKPVKLDEKPPYSYATLIAHAILSSKEKKMMLHEIYQWISEHYPCYSMKDHRWQNSIRHNLSLQKAFVKLERNASGTSGKGCFWTILPGYEQQFIDNLVKRGMGRRSGQTTSFKQCRKFMSDKHSSKNAPLFTIFRMNPTYVTTKKKKLLQRDDDCDSAVDLGCDPIPMEPCQPPPQQDYMHLLDPSIFDMSYLDDMFQPLDVQVNSWLDLQWQDLPLDMYPTYELPVYGQTENTFFI